jgi:putative ABC transport system permease protein
MNSEFTVTAVVEPLPLNTHFTFDMLGHIESPWGNTEAEGLEFYTFYLVEAGRPVADVRAAIEREYTALSQSWAEWFSGKAWGETRMLTDIYLKSKADWPLGKNNTMGFIWMLSALAFFILMFAVTNFINLFTAQGETRMKEIAVRKTYGAGVADLVRQLFAEVAVVVVVAFALGMVLAVQLTPAFGGLIQKEIDLDQFRNPAFLTCVAALLVVTIVLSASYTSFFLSRQNPLDIFGKRLRFFRNRRLTIAITCFQSVVTVVLMAFILIVGRQAAWLKDIPVGYDPRGVMVVRSTGALSENYDAVVGELTALPMVEAVSGGQHVVGAMASGQLINNLNSTEGDKLIDEYRILPGLGQLMGFELVEGKFFTDDDPGRTIVLNQAAVKMLGLTPPVSGQQVDYLSSPATVTGVVKDFIYGDPSGVIQPLVFSRPFGKSFLYIRLVDGVSRPEAGEAIQTALRKFDPDFVVNPIWTEDIHEGKFADINNQGRIIFVGSVLSIILAMMGLLAIHLYSASKRTKEIGVRRILGASRGQIFTLLSNETLRWTLLAGVVAVPVAWFLARRMFSSVANHVPLDWTMFVVPIVVQLVVALAVTSGVTVTVSSTNPAKSLKYE